MIDQQTIDAAVKLLLEAAPGSRVILFGSYARGEADERSDLDFLVIEPEVTDRVAEMVRLRKVLRPLHVPAEVIATSRDHFDYWKDTPNSLFYRAVKEGRGYEQVA